MANILGWLVWCFAAIFVALWGVNLAKKLSRKENAGWPVFAPILWGVVCLTITATTDFSKFHLFWMIPLGVIFPLAILCFQLWMQFRQFGTTFKDLMAQMQQNVQQQKILYSGPIELVPVELAAFSHLDLDWYGEARMELESGGFRYVGDLENTTLSRIWPNLRTLIRCFIGPESKEMLAIFNLRVYEEDGSLAMDLKTYDFETKFDDETFLTTSNCGDMNPDESCEGITLDKLPGDTPWKEILQTHRNHGAEMIEANKSSVVPIRTLEEIVAAQYLQHEYRSKAKQTEWAEAENEEDFDEPDEEDEK